MNVHREKVFCQLKKGHEGSHQAVIFWEEGKIPTDEPQPLKSVWVVYRSHGEWEGITIYAICGSDEKAEQAKIRLAAILTVPLTEFEVAEIAFNAGHPFGLLDQNSSFDV